MEQTSKLAQRTELAHFNRPEESQLGEIIMQQQPVGAAQCVSV